jgi:hypothetical protein
MNVQDVARYPILTDTNMARISDRYPALSGLEVMVSEAGLFSAAIHGESYESISLSRLHSTIFTAKTIRDPRRSWERYLLVEWDVRTAAPCGLDGRGGWEKQIKVKADDLSFAYDDLDEGRGMGSFWSESSTSGLRMCSCRIFMR